MSPYFTDSIRSPTAANSTISTPTVISAADPVPFSVFEHRNDAAGGEVEAQQRQRNRTSGPAGRLYSVPSGPAPSRGVVRTRHPDIVATDATAHQG
jgi:hypothetical protein